MGVVPLTMAQRFRVQAALQDEITVRLDRKDALQLARMIEQQESLTEQFGVAQAFLDDCRAKKRQLADAVERVTAVHFALDEARRKRGQLLSRWDVLFWSLILGGAAFQFLAGLLDVSLAVGVLV